MSAVTRLDLPAGTVPPVRDFMRHVWRYRDENGGSVLVAPPGNILTLTIGDVDEADAAVIAVDVLVKTLGYGERIKAQFRGPYVLVQIQDLHTVHAFLSMLSTRPAGHPAREVAAECLSMLGFRWT